MGTIDRLPPDQSNKYPVATHHANIFYEFRSTPIKFVIEADDIPEPVLVFSREEYNMAIIGDGSKILLKLGRATAYEISFNSASDRTRFTNHVFKFINEGAF